METHLGMTKSYLASFNSHSCQAILVSDVGPHIDLDYKNLLNKSFPNQNAHKHHIQAFNLWCYCTITFICLWNFSTTRTKKAKRKQKQKPKINKQKENPTTINLFPCIRILEAYFFHCCTESDFFQCWQACQIRSALGRLLSAYYFYYKSVLGLSECDRWIGAREKSLCLERWNTGRIDHDKSLIFIMVLLTKDSNTF